MIVSIGTNTPRNGANLTIVAEFNFCSTQLKCVELTGVNIYSRIYHEVGVKPKFHSNVFEGISKQ